MLESDVTLPVHYLLCDVQVDKLQQSDADRIEEQQEQPPAMMSELSTLPLCYLSVKI